VESDAYRPGKKMPLPEARCEHGRANELWTAHEFVFLLLGREPLSPERLGQKASMYGRPRDRSRFLPPALRRFSSEFRGFYTGILTLVDNSVRTQTLSVADRFTDAYKPRDILSWAQARGYPIREELQPLLVSEPPPSPEEDGRIRADTQESLLMMIALLSRALVSKSGPGAGDVNRPNQSFLVQAIQEAAREAKVGNLIGLSTPRLQARLKDALALVRDTSHVEKGDSSHLSIPRLASCRPYRGP
jgi:hypothetical protein